MIRVDDMTQFKQIRFCSNHSEKRHPLKQKRERDKINMRNSIIIPRNGIEYQENVQKYIRIKGNIKVNFHFALSRYTNIILYNIGACHVLKLILFLPEFHTIFLNHPFSIIE